MNEKIVFIRTSSGEDEVRSRTAHLSKDIKRALLMVDGSATVAEIMKRSSPSLRGMLGDMLTELARGGFIRDKSKLPPKTLPPIKKTTDVDELDFTAAYRAPTQAMLEAEAAKLHAASAGLSLLETTSSLNFFVEPRPADKVATDAAKAAEIEAQRLAAEHSRLEAEVSRLKQQAADEARARAAAEAQAKAGAEAVQQARIDAARIEAERVEAVRLESERLAREAVELEAARVRAEAEAERRAAEARLRAEVERKAREAIEAEQQAAKRQAEQQALEAARQRARLEAEVAALRVKAENEARVAAEEHAKREAAEARERAERLAHEEAVRQEALQHASQLQAQAELRSRVVAEERARLEAEVSRLKEQAEAESRQREQARQEAEAVKLQAQQQAEQARLEAMAVAEAARLQAQREVEQQAAQLAREVQEARHWAEQEAQRAQAEAEQVRLHAAAEVAAREQAERMAREAEAAKLQAEQEAARIKAEALAQVHAAEEAALKIQQDVERLTQTAATAGQREMPPPQITLPEIVLPEIMLPEIVSSGAPLTETAPVKSDDFSGFQLAEFDTLLSNASQAEPVVPQPVSEVELHEDIAGLMLKEADTLRAVAQVETLDVPESAPLPEDVLSADEARQLAEAQAKKWAEAEQRAAQSVASAQASAPQPVSPPQPKSRPAAVRQKPGAWGKWLTGGGVLAVAALFVLPAVLPMQGYVSQIERHLGQKLQQPVHIGHLSGRILPTPQLVFEDMTIGAGKTLQLKQAKARFDFASLLSEVKPIQRLELDGLQLDGAALPGLSDWLQRLAADRPYPLAVVALSHAQLDAEGVQLDDVDGELAFDASGKFAETHLTAHGHKLALDLHATPEQKIQLAFTLHDTALPLFPNWNFEDLKATGELGREELRINELDGRILGGALTGEVRINWRSGWRVHGALMGKVIPLQNLNKQLSGDLDGSAHFQMQADSLSHLADAALLNGVFTVQKGVINGLDVVETTRLRSRDSLPGGRTHFDELSGELSFANDGYQFRQLKLRDSVVSATGSCSVNGQQLSGMLSSNLTLRAGAVALQLGGTMASPTLKALR